jgi:hypothetical protein
MAASRRWVAGAVVVVVAIVAGIVVVRAHTSSTAGAPRWQVIDIATQGGPLRGQVLDVIGVAGAYVGLVEAGSAPWFVTSEDGLGWEAVRPVGLPPGPIEPMVHPGGLNNVEHMLFTDGEAVYLRLRTGSSYDRLGSVSLYISNAAARTWRPMELPAPPGKGAFPIAAATANGRRYLAGAVYDPLYGYSYLDAAVWMSEGNDAWRFLDAPAFTGDGNQTIFALAVKGHTILAGGGDGALVPNTLCCFFPDGAAFWRSVDGGEQWSRAPARDGPYAQYPSNEHAAVLGFIDDGAAVHADVSAYPPRTAQSRDLGESWAVTLHSATDPGVLVPRASHVLELGRHAVATTVPTDVGADSRAGALAFSEDGVRWRDVTPRFPCGTKGRTNYGFVSRPVAIGSSITALAACGRQLSEFDETLLATSDDNGAHWEVRRFDGPTGGPLSAVAGNDRIVTLTGANTETSPNRIRAVVVYP